jgi:hypothetical protein
MSACIEDETITTYAPACETDKAVQFIPRYQVELQATTTMAMH